MARVIIQREPSCPPLPRGWLVKREEGGRGSLEGLGFKSRTEARLWAEKWGHIVVGVAR